MIDSIENRAGGLPSWKRQTGLATSWTQAIEDVLGLLASDATIDAFLHFTLATLVPELVAPAGFAVNGFTSSGDFEPLAHRLVCFEFRHGTVLSLSQLRCHK